MVVYGDLVLANLTNVVGEAISNIRAEHTDIPLLSYLTQTFTTRHSTAAPHRTNTALHTCIDKYAAARVLLYAYLQRKIRADQGMHSRTTICMMNGHYHTTGRINHLPLVCYLGTPPFLLIPSPNPVTESVTASPSRFSYIRILLQYIKKGNPPRPVPAVGSTTTTTIVV